MIDLELASRAILFSAVGTAGQRCTTLRRLIVHESIADCLIARLQQLFARVNVGDPRAPSTLIGPLIGANPGRRVPGHVEPHEIAFRAVLGQQVSLAGAATLAGRLVADYGESLRSPLGSVTHIFPSAGALARADPDRLPMPASRRRALLGLAEALDDGRVVLGPRVDRVEARRRLLELPGIGPWTADYVALRAFGDRDAFLASDLGVRRALERLGLNGSPANAARLAESWRPYRAYALMHLWATLANP